LLFNVLIFIIAAILSLITPEDRLPVLFRLTLKNLIYVYITVLVLGIGATIITVLF
jgi:hypothetical protein